MEEDFNMSTPGVKVGVSEEEKKLSYYKYYEQDLAPVPAEKSLFYRADRSLRKNVSRLMKEINS